MQGELLLDGEGTRGAPMQGTERSAHLHRYLGKTAPQLTESTLWQEASGVVP